MRDYLIKRPMLLCGMGCVAVSFIAFYRPSLLGPPLFALPVISGFLIFKKADTRLIFVSVLLFVMCASCVLTLREIKEMGYTEGTQLQAELTVYEVTYQAEEYYIADCEIIKSDLLEKGTKITLFFEPWELKSGQRIKAEITLSQISDEYKKDSYSRDIYIQGYMTDISVLKSQDFILTVAENIRSYIKSTLLKYTDFGESATLFALIFGEKGYFMNEFYELVKSAGVAHVMVVSGMHMAILVNFFSRLSKKLFYNRFFKAIIMSTVVLVLWLLCGFTMSVLRAGVTYILMALGVVIDRKGKPENTLGAAVTLILISSPFAMFSISLQLSVLSTFGILAVAIPVTDFIAKNKIIKNKAFLEILKSVIFSLSALLLTLPVTISTFGYISVVGIFTNLLISSAVTADLSVAVIGLLLSLVSEWLAYPFLTAANILTKYINYIIEGFGGLSFAVADLRNGWVMLRFSLFSLFSLVYLLVKNVSIC